MDDQQPHQPASSPQFPAPSAGSPLPPPPPPVPAYAPQYVQTVPAAPDKSTGVAYLLWFFIGVFGVHHFYLGKTARGVGYLLTLGWLTIGLWIDLFTLPSQVRAINAQRRAGVR